ncbi:MAG: hypothetical protein Q8M65_03510 [Rhodoglobus sp.]|nr:hypothetical protein [Rhodoglobus sp.]
MPSESDLRKLLSGGEVVNRLETDSIVAQSRRRRLPRQVGAGVFGALAIAGIAVITVPSFLNQPPATVSTLESAGDSLAPEGGGETSTSIIKRAPAERLNLCGAPLAEVEPSTLGLVLEVLFADSGPVGTAPITGTVRLTNTSSAPVSGTTAAAPAVAVSQNGITQWHSPSAGELSAVQVNLAPGESLEYEASFNPVRCGIEDDAGEQFRPGLPPLAAGTYELSAALDFVSDSPGSDDSTFGLELVTGPPSPITLQ